MAYIRYFRQLDICNLLYENANRIFSFLFFNSDYVSERNQFALEKALARDGRVLEAPNLGNYRQRIGDMRRADEGSMIVIVVCYVFVVHFPIIISYSLGISTPVNPFDNPYKTITAKISPMIIIIFD